MGQLQRVSWRTVGYAALGTVMAAASVVAIVHSDGVRPTSLTSSAASRWLVDQIHGNVVLVDGLAGRVVAKIESDSQGTDEVAVQGAGGAFLVGKGRGSVRTISTAKLQLGTPQAVGLLLDPGVQFGVGSSGLTVVSPESSKASVIGLDDVTRAITVPKAKSAYVAADGSMWLVNPTNATHVNVDATLTRVTLRRPLNQTSTIGSRAVSYDANNSTLQWLDGGDVSLLSIPNASEAVLQESSDDAPCAWLGVGDTLICVGPTGIDHTVVVNGMNLSSNDTLAVAGSAAVYVTPNNEITRIDLQHGQIASDPAQDVPEGAQLTITAAGDLIWLDDQSGNDAWIVNRFGINHISKDDANAPQLDAQGQAKPGDGPPGEGGAGGEATGDDESSHLDGNNHDDPPKAVDDSVTARAGNAITIPVTANDFDPDGDAIAVIRVGDTKRATHGVTDILNGSSVAYRPDPGFSGTDSFEYTITDEHGGESTANVNVELFPPGSPNQPPIARADKASTHVGHPVTIDVLANDIDPERDVLTVKNFVQKDSDAATITYTAGPTDLSALKYSPPDTPGQYTFTYQAADPQGGTSQKTLVTVTVAAQGAQNVEPKANPDSVRLPIGKQVLVNVKANDVDADGDDLTISADQPQPRGIDVTVSRQQLAITLEQGAPKSSVVRYTLSDGIHKVVGKVLVLLIDDSAPNRPPVANADAERVVIGNTVKIPVTANDVDPDHDDIRLLSVSTPADGAGTTVVEGNSVRFTPNLPDITVSTAVTFTYIITDGHGNESPGNVTVTVLLEALPRAPFARDDFADTTVDKPVNIDVLANDSDPSGGLPNLIGNPSCSGGGSATSTPDNRVIFVPPLGGTGTFRCKYTVINTQLLKAEANIIVTVTSPPPGNRDPDLNPQPPLKEVRVGESIPISVTEFANDPDGDPLVFSSVSKPKYGSTDFNGSKATLVYTAPATGSADKTPEGDSIDVIISDGQNGNVRTSISIKIVDNPPPPPSPAAPETIPFTRSAFVGDPVSVDVLTPLHDRNPLMTLSLTNAFADSGPGSAQVVNGLVNVNTNAAGTVVVTYTVTNGDNIAANGTITVTVVDKPQNAPPVAVDDTLTVASGGSNTVDLLANDSGINDPGDKAVINLVNKPPSTFGTVDISGGVLTFVAAPDTAGNAVIKYTLSDGSGQSSTANITINILQCSDSPASARSAFVFTPYQTPLPIDLGQYVQSGSIRPGSVTGAGLTGPTGVYTPPAGFNGNELVTFIVENGCHQGSQFQLTIDVNRTPVAGTVTKNMSHGDVVVLNAANLASDDEPLTIVSLTGQPSWVTLLPGSTTGASGTFDEPTIQLAPPSNVSGPFSFTATVQDPGGLTAVASVNGSVTNLAPTAVPDQYPPTTDSLITFDPTQNDTDPEGGPLTIQNISWSSPPDGGPITRNGNTVTVPLTHGISTLSYTIVDDGGLTASSTITLTSNNPPTMAGFTDTTNQPTFDENLSPNDPDGDDTVVTCDTTTNFDILITPDPNAGPPPDGHRVKLHFVVKNAFEGTETFLCHATDPFGAVATASVTLTITD